MKRNNQTQLSCMIVGASLAVIIILVVVAALANSTKIDTPNILEVYTSTDLLYINLDELRITCETGYIDETFTSFEEVKKFVANNTAQASEIQNYEIVNLVSNYSHVGLDKDYDVSVTVHNPFNDFKYSKILTKCDTLDEGIVYYK